ncbi:MAG: hypothetical protein R3A13_03010 [Bdellovibrionota bacterium]
MTSARFSKKEKASVFVETALVLLPLLLIVFLCVELSFIHKNLFLMVDAYKTVSAQSSLNETEAAYLEECEDYLEDNAYSADSVTCEIDATNGNVKTLLITLVYNPLTPIATSDGMNIKYSSAFYDG